VIELSLGGGRRVLVDASVDAAALARVLDVLERRRRLLAGALAVPAATVANNAKADHFRKSFMKFSPGEALREGNRCRRPPRR
jgi:hypothetical protein